MNSSRMLSLAGVVAILLADRARELPPVGIPAFPEAVDHAGPVSTVPAKRDRGLRFLTCGACGHGGGTLLRDGSGYRHRKC